MRLSGHSVTMERSALKGMAPLPRTAPWKLLLSKSAPSRSSASALGCCETALMSQELNVR